MATTQLPKTNKEWILNEYVKGPITDKTFSLKESPVETTVPDGKVLVKVLTLGLEPAIRPSLSDEPSYRAPHPLGTPVWAYGIGIVAATSSPNTHPVGSKVVGLMSWSQYALADATALRPYNEQIGLQHLSALGGPGLAAHIGLFHNVGMKKGEVVLVSGAAGATGSIVVQLAKAAGASKIIGVASKSKCQSVVDNGADVCLDYGAPSFEEDLIKATERKVDVFFDNVGGLVLDAALLCMAKQGRISVCGAISGYQSIGGDRSQAYALKNHTMILRSVLTVKGFIVLPPYTSQEELGKAVAELGKAVMEGKVKTSIYKFPEEGVEHVPAALHGLLTGQNTGKMTIKIADE